MKKFGMLWIAHGSRDPKWVAGLDQAWEAVLEKWDGPAFLSFLELVEGRLIQDGIDSLESQGVTDVIVVPLFVSSGSTHTEEIAWALGLIPHPFNETELEPFRRNAIIHWTGPMDTDELPVAVMRERVQALSINPAEEVLLLIGHGSEVGPFATAWNRQLSEFGERFTSEFGFAAFEVATIMPLTVRESAEMILKKYATYTVLAVPLFISPGYYTSKKIPVVLEGLMNVRYTGDTLLPDPRVAEWAIRKALERRRLEEMD